MTIQIIQNSFEGERQTFELNSNEITITIKNRIRVYFVCNQILRETNPQLFQVFIRGALS